MLERAKTEGVMSLPGSIDKIGDGGMKRGPRKVVLGVRGEARGKTPAKLLLNSRPLGKHTSQTHEVYFAIDLTPPWRFIRSSTLHRARCFYDRLIPIRGRCLTPSFSLQRHRERQTMDTTTKDDVDSR
jgi:hypothetical protein